MAPPFEQIWIHINRGNGIPRLVIRRRVSRSVAVYALPNSIPYFHYSNNELSLYTITYSSRNINVQGVYLQSKLIALYLVPLLTL